MKYLEGYELQSDRVISRWSEHVVIDHQMATVTGSYVSVPFMSIKHTEHVERFHTAEECDRILSGLEFVREAQEAALAKAVTDKEA